MNSIGYFEAWERWFNGDTALRDARLWRLHVLWWGRVGKLAAFFAGMALILDIIGPERLRQFSTRYVRRNNLPRSSLGPALLGAVAAVFLLWATFFPGKVSFLGFEIAVYSFGVTSAIAVFVLVISLVLLAPALLEGVRRGLVLIFERDALARTVQVTALVLFVAGFHFDMLAS
ncbi:hypothetical protein [Allokutzneria albata]|uniref:Uncharacterized protein n=1 Tax=Allokutzneria albata TaxID=211114 RepID=A0A1G9U8E4_ALLAB|nr:hypothetical protein [Allokutzneria albata]SDM55974.1 hypothetical protein SAMN04489726_2243 [Allokutzneria albata]